MFRLLTNSQREKSEKTEVFGRVFQATITLPAAQDG
jgi:hypothetical protein